VLLPDIENPHEAGVHDADDARQKRPAEGVFGGAFVGKVPVFVGEVPVR
jgi:hypothetical protein